MMRWRSWKPTIELNGTSRNVKSRKQLSLSVSVRAEVAQLVEQTIRNRQVAGSTPALGSILIASSSQPVNREPTGTNAE